MRQGYEEQIEDSPNFSVRVVRHSETSLHWYYRHAECLAIWRDLAGPAKTRELG